MKKAKITRGIRNSQKTLYVTLEVLKISSKTMLISPIKGEKNIKIIQNINKFVFIDSQPNGFVF